MKLPKIGLGTWDLRGEACTKAVKIALELGYQHIDTAYGYFNHKEIRKGMKGTDRTKLYITSKIPLEIVKKKGDVEKRCDQALKELGLDYLDLYLIHWPNLKKPMSEIFSEMKKLIKKGKIRKAGVSNFTIHHLEDLRKAGHVPAVNQVEFHPYLHQLDLLEYCRKKKIELIAYRPFGQGPILKEPIICQIAKKAKKNPAQVILRWLMQQKIPTIPKASSRKHLEENLEVFDFQLTKAEMKKIDGLHRNRRFCHPDDPTFDY